MARTPVMAAGGIVMRSEAPLIAIVRLRKRDHWVLPKGKLDAGETARAAAEREVMEETGHDVTVHEFVGTVAYEAGGRPKIVHFWRMEASGDPAHPLMRDVKAVTWLPLDKAIAQLTRSHEQAFLAEIGPKVLAAAGLGAAAQSAPDLAPLAEGELPSLLPGPDGAGTVAVAARRSTEAAAAAVPAQPGLRDVANAPALAPAWRPGWLSWVRRLLSGGN
ncbi:MAG: NUDIX hydrolase [Xanthobacteraceae bacterium]